MFPMPRIVYALSSDGLIFKFLSKLIPKLKTPAIAASITGILSGILTLIFNLEQLIDMMSIGTLLAYSIVSACALILRYKPFVVDEQSVTREPGEKIPISSYIFGDSKEKLHKRLFYTSATEASKETSHLVTATVLFSSNEYKFLFIQFLNETLTNYFFNILQVIDIVIICLIYNYGDFSSSIVPYIFQIIFLTILVIFSYTIWIQPQNKQITTFKVPFVPFFPLLSAFVNIYLMTTLNLSTWVRFIIWFVIGK
jgi:amino acid transporter